jgi:hypothetical protein
VAACVAAFNTRFSASYMTPEIVIVRCAVERTVLRSAHMHVLKRTSSDGCPARISLPLTNPRLVVTAVFVGNAARLWALRLKVAN